MAYEYTTVTVDLTENGSGGATGTIYAELFHTVTLANNDTVAPQVYSATVTAGAATLTLPCTATALMNTNAPFLVTFVPTGGKRRTLGRIITTESASAVQLSDLLEVGGSSAVPVTTYNIEATNLVTSPSIAALQAIRNQEDGARVLVQDIGIYRYSLASTATANEATVVTPASASGRWILEGSAIAFGENYNLKLYGALGDGTTNDYTAIQATIAAAEAAVAVGFAATIVVPPGVYMCGTGLVQTETSKAINWRGEGPRVSVIKAVAGSGITLLTVAPSSTSGTHSSKRIEGIGFAGNNTCPVIVSAQGLRYSIFRDCRFEDPATDGACLSLGYPSGGGWVNRVEDCRFEGSTGNGIVGTAGASFNNCIITGCDFSTLKVGITLNGGNDVIITENNFDACTGAAIWSKQVVRHLTIERNYFEACGSTGVSVQEAVSTFVTWYGAVVAHGIYTTTGYYLGLKIRDNFYANCSTEAYNTLSHLSEAEVSGNQTHESYTSKFFVKIDWLGVNYSTARRVIIDHVQYRPGTITGTTNTSTSITSVSAADIALVQEGMIVTGTGIPSQTTVVSKASDSFVLSKAATASATVTLTLNSQFGALVALTPDTPRDGTCGMVIRDRSAFPQNVTAPGSNLFGNPMSWTLLSGSFTTFQRDGTFDGDAVWKLDGTGILQYAIAATEDVLPGLAGRYWRPQFISRGDTGNANGLRLRVYYDTGAGYVEQYAATAPSGTDWAANRMPTFYIPANIAAFKLTVQPLFNTIPCWFTHFNISLADVDVVGAPPQPDVWLNGSATWNPGSIADGDMEAKNITVSGAQLGDYVLVSFSLDVVDLTLTGTVTAADVVTAVLANNTGAAVDLASGTVRARVMKL